MKRTFELSVSFSLYNGAVVLSQTSERITFGLLDLSDEVLKSKLEKAVRKFFLFDSGSDLSVAADDRKKIGSEKRKWCDFIEITREELENHVSLCYGHSNEKVLTRTLSGPPSRAESMESDKPDAGRAAIMLLDLLLNQAGSTGATDIHIEEKQVRFRVEGNLKKICELSPEKSCELVRRIKVLSKLDVMEKRKGQDGQFVFFGRTRIFVRVSVVPHVTVPRSKEYEENSSETVVMRLLDVSRVPLDIEKLGFDHEECCIIRKMVKNDSGLLLICGATGSGKSTTAASLLSEINRFWNEKKKIITIEDPPEYLLDGVTQIRVDSQLGMSYSDSLRYVFRQDPDVIYIGEIRDELSARTGIQAALTGHLVLATVHASGIEECILRMEELGIGFSTLKTVLKGLIFQQMTEVFDAGKKRMLLKPMIVQEIRNRNMNKSLGASVRCH